MRFKQVVLAHQVHQQLIIRGLREFKIKNWFLKKLLECVSSNNWLSRYYLYFIGIFMKKNVQEYSILDGLLSLFCASLTQWIFATVAYRFYIDKCLKILFVLQIRRKNSGGLERIFRWIIGKELLERWPNGIDKFGWHKFCFWIMGDYSTACYWTDLFSVQ